MFSFEYLHTNVDVFVFIQIKNKDENCQNRVLCSNWECPQLSLKTKTLYLVWCYVIFFSMLLQCCCVCCRFCFDIWQVVLFLVLIQLLLLVFELAILVSINLTHSVETNQKIFSHMHHLSITIKRSIYFLKTNSPKGSISIKHHGFSCRRVSPPNDFYI